MLREKKKLRTRRAVALAAVDSDCALHCVIVAPAWLMQAPSSGKGVCPCARIHAACPLVEWGALSAGRRPTARAPETEKGYFALNGTPT